MSHYVLCKICGKRFDRDVIQAVRVGSRRYAHAECDPENKDFVPLDETKKKKKEEKSLEEEDLTKLKSYINKKMGKMANWVLITRQIKQYKKDYNYTYSGILKSLIYFIDVKKNGLEKSNGGIGIVPFTYNEARDYYYALWLAQQQNKDKLIKDTVKEIIIKEPRKSGVIKKFFDLGENDE